MRDGLSRALVELGAKDERIVVLGADTSLSIKTSLFGSKYPHRFFNVGIAEQNLIGIAAGLAMSGKIAFLSTYSAFVPGKCLDQIRNAVAYPNLDVKIVSSHGGITVGPDGASHQTVEDLAAMRAVPRLKVVVPSDAPSTESLIREIARTSGPFYVRLARPSTPLVHSPGVQMEIGKAITVREGTDASVVACGIMVPEALQAADEMKKQGLSLRVIDCHTLKPLDEETIIKAAADTGSIVTAEEHNIIGGLGSAVAEVLSESRPTPMRRIGIMDTFGESGEHNELLAKYGLTAKNIVSAVKTLQKVGA
jgi:transketolase